MWSYQGKIPQIVWGLLVFVLAPNVAMPVTANERHEDQFYLSVELNDVYNHHLKLRVPVSADKPFEFTAEKKGVKTVVSGVIHDPNDGKYPLTLKISEESLKGNRGDSIELQLQLGRSQSYGPTSSFVYQRTVKLSKRKQ